jgi:hypothetical protein
MSIKDIITTEDKSVTYIFAKNVPIFDYGELCFA